MNDEMRKKQLLHDIGMEEWDNNETEQLLYDIGMEGETITKQQQRDMSDAMRRKQRQYSW